MKIILHINRDTLHVLFDGIYQAGKRVALPDQKNIRCLDCGVLTYS
ncbi:hypothetical protein SAMN04487930_11257 [Cytophaga hutchinsonii ATCC 33406]|nr:hypothetical protein SAMN04487930_11257 [Cytophaga hutchinsonii ATCC 33406]